MSHIHIYSEGVAAPPPAIAGDPGILPDDFPEFIITRNGETAPGPPMGSVNSTVASAGMRSKTG